jgi:hypothetical protein
LNYSVPVNKRKLSDLTHSRNLPTGDIRGGIATCIGSFGVEHFSPEREESIPQISGFIKSFLLDAAHGGRREKSRRTPAMIPFDAQAEIPKEIQRVVRLDVRVHPIRDVGIHFFGARKRTIAVADDVEVPEVKIGREPRIGHFSIMKDH